MPSECQDSIICYIRSSQGAKKHADVDCRLGCISMWEVNKLSRGFYDMCNSIRWSSVSSPQGMRNLDTYPFETLPHYPSSSLCQNYFAVKITRFFLNAYNATLVLTVICNKSSFFPEHPPHDMQHLGLPHSS